MDYISDERLVICDWSGVMTYSKGNLVSLECNCLMNSWY